MSIIIEKNGNISAIVKEGVEKAILEICAKVAAQAVSLAPEGETSFLRGSGVYKTPIGGSGELEGEPDPKPLSGYVGFNAFYAPYVEFGTRKMRPQPFLRPAIAIKALGANGAEIMKRRQEEVMRGKLKEGQIRETFNLR